MSSGSEAVRGWTATAEQTAALRAVTRLFADGATPEEAAELAAVKLAALLQDGCVVGLIAEDGTLHPVGVHHPDDVARERHEDREPMLLPPGEGYTAEVIEECKPMIVRRAEDAPDRSDGHLERRGETALLAAPLRTRGEVIGVLIVVRDPGKPDFDPSDLEFVVELADRLAFGIDNARLAEALAMQRDLPHGELSGRVPEGEQLTRRELEILELLADGLTNKQVAERLVLSVRTVEWHRARVQAKLGVSDRAGLVKALAALRGA